MHLSNHKPLAVRYVNEIYRTTGEQREGFVTAIYDE